MKSIESLGSFWIPGAKDEALDGRLVFDPEDGGRLELVGAFGGAHGLNDEQFLHGVIDSGEISIDNCFFQGTSSRSSGLDLSRYYINSLILGRHLEPDFTGFKNAYLRTSVGNDWVGKKIGHVGSPQGVGEDVAPWLTYARPVDEVGKFSRGELALRYAWTSSGAVSVNRVAFEHWPVVAIAYTSATSLDLIKEDAGYIADLMTLCADEVATTDTLSVSHPDLRVRMLSGFEGPEQELEVLAPQLSYKQSLNRKQRHAHQMLLTYDELGGIEAVAKWVDVCPKFGRALASMVSVRRRESMFAENRFLNIAAASEAFHRDMYGGEMMPQSKFDDLARRCVNAVPEARRGWLQQKLAHANDPTFRRRLTDLCSRAGSTVDSLCGNKARWIDTITLVRNHLTHLDSAKLNVDGGDLYFLAESLYSVIRACMLIEVGVPPQLIANKAETYAFSWYRNRLAEAIEHVRARLRESPAHIGGEQL